MQTTTTNSTNGSPQVQSDPGTETENAVEQDLGIASAATEHETAERRSHETAVAAGHGTAVAAGHGTADRVFDEAIAGVVADTIAARVATAWGRQTQTVGQIGTPRFVFPVLRYVATSLDL